MSERITITVETGNAAFDDSPTEEVARILERLAQKFRDDGDLDGLPVQDTNGNTVGTVTIRRL